VAGIPDELTVGAGGSAGASPEDVCERESIPPKPSVSPAGGDGAFVVAIRSLQLEKASGGTSPGMNLDGLCSCTEDDRACRSLDPDDEGGACDMDRGRDSQSQALFSAVAYLLGVSEVTSYYGALSAAGDWTVLLRVRGYGGGDARCQAEPKTC
jgi:hypothetical protein